MSKKHHTAMHRSMLVQGDESVDDAINYRVEILSAIDFNHDAFDRTLRDLMSLLINGETFANVLEEIQGACRGRGDLVAAENLNQAFTNAALRELHRIGLSVPTSFATPKSRKVSSPYSLNPCAPPYPSLSSTAISNTVPALGQETGKGSPSRLLSSTSASPTKAINGWSAPITVSMPPGPANTHSKWSFKKDVAITGLGDVSENELYHELEKHTGSLVGLIPTKGEAVASFPAVAGSDMLNVGTVKLWDHVYNVKPADTAEVRKLTQDKGKPESPDWNDHRPAAAHQMNGMEASLDSKVKLPGVGLEDNDSKQDLDWNGHGAEVPPKGGSTTSAPVEVEVLSAGNPKPDLKQQNGEMPEMKTKVEDESVKSGVQPVSGTIRQTIGGMDDFEFADWKKAFKPKTYGAPIEAVVEPEASGWATQEEPTGESADLAAVFSLARCLPWNDRAVTMGLINLFGQNKVKLWRAHRSEHRYDFEKTVNYFVKFEDPMVAPAMKEQEICLIPTGGDGGNGWYAKMKPAPTVEINAQQVIEEGLLGELV